MKKVKCKGIGIAIISGLLITVTLILVFFSMGLHNQKYSKWKSEDGNFIIYIDLSISGFSTIKINGSKINGGCEIREDGSIIIDVEYHFSKRANKKILERWVVTEYNLFSFTAEVEYSNTYDVGEEITFKRVGATLFGWHMYETNDCTDMKFEK